MLSLLFVLTVAMAAASEMPADLRRILDSVPPQTRGIEYHLWNERFAVTNETVYALFPLPRTHCSAHSRITSAMRSAQDVMQHLTAHHLEPGTVRRLVAVCEFCSKEVPLNGIRNHIQFVHGALPFSTKDVDIASLRQKPTHYYPFHST